MNLPPGHTHHKGIERTVCPTQAGGLGSTKRDLLGCWWRVNNDTLVALLADCGKKTLPTPSLPAYEENFLLPLPPPAEKLLTPSSPASGKNFLLHFLLLAEKLPTPSFPAWGITSHALSPRLRGERVG
ncbi:MAG: hypothetical protein KatS3mg110_2852 [Pirellulaceae bacterium]|nr:MAG: hypothetical protein KatS3mg110_2852 [Pirellulaceae bacterium]